MKKYLGLALLASIATTSAFASIARLEALGEDQYGSQYINDNRNAFLNAATINDHGSYATFEWGDTTKFKNEEGTPKAQGGVFKKQGNTTYGVYFGDDSNTASDLRAGGFSVLENGGGLNANEKGTLATWAQNENSIDLFYGKHAQAKDDQGKTGGTGLTVGKLEKKGTLLGLGMISGENEAYANIGLQNEYKLTNINNTAATALDGSDYHFKGKIGYQLGYIRNLNHGAKAFVEYQNQATEEKEQSSLSEEWTVTKIKLGWAKTSKLNDKFTAFYKVLYSNTNNKNYVYRDAKDKTQTLGATFGFEVMAKEWLTFRGSVANNFFGENENDDGDKKTVSDAVDVKLGATLAFGDFAIDGLIGNDNDGDGTAAETGDDNGTIRTDALMSRVSMTYKF